MRRTSLLAALVGLLLLSASPASAQSVRKGKRGDELQDRIPAVSGPLFLKAGRHELSPLVSLSLADPFRRKLGGGLYYAWHLQEYFGLSARVSYNFLATDSGAVQVCPTPDSCSGPGDDALDTLPGNLTLVAALSGEVSPLYGKLNIIAEWVIHFDIFGSVGAGVVGFQSASAAPEAALGLAVPLSVGQRIFFNEWFALRLEFSDLLYTQKDVNEGRRLRGQLAFTASASFFFPTTFSYRSAN
ncbi:MAG: outer membrane beta-barrel domain-containing protein [Deltaproteobacteria bacterium]|nr:outer membrane beta-barrel domain-containing protein [Deltaproteobacteria bacterium]